MANCCVPYCKSYYKLTKKNQMEEGYHVSYHEFPNDLNLQEKWLKAIARKDYVVNDKSGSSRVCSRHFKEEDFVPFTKVRRLKPGTIPSIFDYRPSSASCPVSPKKRKLDSAEIIVPDIVHKIALENGRDIVHITTQENGPDIVHIIAQENGANNISLRAQENSTTVLSLQEELKRRELALEEQYKRLNSKRLEIRKLKRQLKIKSQQLIKKSTTIEGMERKLKDYNNNIHHKTLKKLLEMQKSGSIEPKHAFLLTQLKFMFNKSFRWPESVLRECVFLHAMSPCGYKALAEKNLINLPSISTLNRYTNKSILNDDMTDDEDPISVISMSNQPEVCHFDET